VHAAAGWTAYAPLSSVDPSYTGVGGQNLWCISLIVLGISSMMGSINYITTVINMRAPGMTMVPHAADDLVAVHHAILLLLALPVLTGPGDAALRPHGFGTTASSPPAGGGEPLLWQHLFWFFGHPEVYILILPAMGIASEILPSSPASRSSATGRWRSR
jgi:cytochrome c oxidase subunit I